MVSDFKDEALQELFTNAIKTFGGKAFGFQCDGTVILTSDRGLLDKLKQAQQEEIDANPGRINQPRIEELNYGLLVSMDIPLVISMFYPNALFFRQGEYVDCFGYPKEIGGEKTLILSDDAKKLKKFVSPVIEKHLDDFGINFKTRSFFQDPTEPALSADLVVKDKKVSGLMNGGCYNSRLLLQSAVDDVIFAINDTQREDDWIEDEGKC